MSFTVNALSPLPAAGFLWRPRFGGQAFAVVTKATFDLRLGGARLAAEQAPLVEREGASTAPLDLVPFRDGVDVTVVSRAKRDGRLQVGAIDKRGAASAFAPRTLPRDVLDPNSTTWRRAALPAALGPSSFNAAPEDQRLDELAPDARILLENLHPHLPRFTCRLPGLRPRAFIARSGGARELFLRADALWIDMRHQRCTLSWRGSFDVDDAEATGRVLIALEHPGERLCWPDVAALAAQESEDVDDRPSQVRLRTPTARVSEPGDPPTSRRLPAHPPVEPQSVEPERDEDTMVMARPVPPSAALPFARPASSLPPPPAPPVRRATVRPSPWAPGGIARAVAVAVPETAPDAEPVAPPLMLVAEPVVAAPETADAASFLEVLGRDEDTPWMQERLQSRWPAAEADEDFEQEMRRIFGSDRGRPDAGDVDTTLATILAEEQADDTAALQRLVREAVEDGVFTPCVALLQGELTVAFDEERRLDATLNALTPHLDDDDALAEEVARVRKLVRRGALAEAPEIAASLTEDLHGRAEKAGVDLGALDARIERQLLRGRHYRVERLLGDRFLAATLALGDVRLPCYLPAGLREALPLYGTFATRLVAEIHPRQDQTAKSPIVLRALGLGRRSAASFDLTGGSHGS